MIVKATSRPPVSRPWKNFFVQQYNLACSRSSRGRPLNAPAAFIHPCQPIVAKQAPSGPSWAHELKHDGYRLHVRDGRNFSTRSIGTPSALLSTSPFGGRSGLGFQAWGIGCLCF
jgi:hypothetical protein